ncbi:snRNA-activating protein complex subunit 1-like isoform X2 [Vespa mandarinia]|uniref:snRNA-activating protein complex subunit 1-like isoform X2 n=1 Tax=Vespa mandarinia TaxID=7446 RepID=UPI00161F480F|nr:snRNA-activating protein complex subunit 1-like isoform X2 [Vespa mandarinia]
MSASFNITAGFREDCIILIDRFEKVDDIRFKSFSEIWKDLKFSLIFKDKEHVAELMEFCEEILHLTKQYLFSGTFKERICGLYLLYGIYFKMPCFQFKIRITLTEWQMIMELHNQIREGEHHDANYILSKLIINNAFKHCLFDQEISFEKCFRKRYYYNNNPYSVLSSIKNMGEKDQIFEKINKLSKTYHQKKCEAIGSNTDNCSLNLFNSNFATEIINDIHTFNRGKGYIKEMCTSASKKDIKEIEGSLQSDKKIKRLDLDDAYLSSSSDIGSNVSPLNIIDNNTESIMDEFAE